MSFNRRRFLAAAGTGAAGLTAGGAVARATELSAAATDSTVPFYAEHQAGIATAAQQRLVFGAFDVTATTREELRDLLREWTVASAAMSLGHTVGPALASPYAPPLDTGEALGLGPANLTVTIGFGTTLFELAGKDRFGIASRRPAGLDPIGHLPGDALEAARTGGDLCVQACSDDPQVAFHAVRNLARIGRGAVTLRWTQLGFGRTSTTRTGQSTPRNLQGFKDGTNNLRGDNLDDMRRFVFLDEDEPAAWMRGGTYLVARRIRMYIEEWDRAELSDQEQTIGRKKVSGAPLTGTKEHDTVELTEKKHGEPVIPLNAHIRLASPKSHGGERILRRGYSFTDGIDPETGELDAGLFFICFQRDPKRQFAAIQTMLGEQDALGEYIVHTGGGLFAVPPGAKRGGYVGEGLFV